jgi:hypothetical protein
MTSNLYLLTLGFLPAPTLHLFCLPHPTAKAMSTKPATPPAHPALLVGCSFLGWQAPTPLLPSNEFAAKKCQGIVALLDSSRLAVHFLAGSRLPRNPRLRDDHPSGQSFELMDCRRQLASRHPR